MFIAIEFRRKMLHIWQCRYGEGNFKISNPYAIPERKWLKIFYFRILPCDRPIHNPIYNTCTKGIQIIWPPPYLFNKATNASGSGVTILFWSASEQSFILLFLIKDFSICFFKASNKNKNRTIKMDLMCIFFLRMLLIFCISARSVEQVLWKE